LQDVILKCKSKTHQMKKISLLSVAILFFLTSCHKDRYIEYVAETNIKTLGFDSAAISVSGYLTNSSSNHILGFSYTSEAQVFSWNGQNVEVGGSAALGGSYSDTMIGLIANTTYNLKPFAKVDGKYHYSEKSFSFTTPSSPNSIGSIGPAGGVVFYSDGNGGGMEVLIENWHDKWGGYGVVLPNTNSAIGTGQSNTDIILNYITDCKAAQMCDSCTYGGYTDWFLPSFGELQEIQINLGSGGLYGVPGDIAWCSTGSTNASSQDAWSVNMSNGTYVSSSRNSSRSVLPVRVIQ
jgi:hypothetical protein